jgi:dipeptidyl aminopeptidase/acylaminoacyl peptidase
MDMAGALFAARKPVSLLLIEGADHAITERRDEYYEAARAWMDRYVRDRGRLPNLTPHGT